MFAVRCEHTVKAGEVDAGFGHQGGQPGNEIQRLKDDVRGAIPKALATLAGQAFAVRCLELVPDIAIRRQ